MYINIAKNINFGVRPFSTIVSDISQVVTRGSTFLTPTPTPTRLESSENGEMKVEIKAGQAAIIVLGVVCGLLLLALLLAIMIILAQLLRGGGITAISNLEISSSMRQQRKRSTGSRVSSGRRVKSDRPRRVPPWGPDVTGNQRDDMIYGQPPIPTALRRESHTSNIGNGGQRHLQNL